MPLYSPKIPLGLNWDPFKSFCQVKSLVGCNIFKLYRNSRIWEKTAGNCKNKSLKVWGRCSRNFWPMKCATCSSGNHVSGKEVNTSHKLAFPWTRCGKFVPGRLISRFGGMCWPPRSPDLTITATLKVRVFQTLSATREELKRKVREEIAAISQQDKKKCNV